MITTTEDLNQVVFGHTDGVLPSVRGGNHFQRSKMQFARLQSERLRVAVPPDHFPLTPPQLCPACTLWHHMASYGILWHQLLSLRKSDKSRSWRMQTSDYCFATARLPSLEISWKPYYLKGSQGYVEIISTQFYAICILSRPFCQDSQTWKLQHQGGQSQWRNETTMRPPWDANHQWLGRTSASPAILDLLETVEVKLSIFNSDFFSTLILQASPTTNFACNHCMLAFVHVDTTRFSSHRSLKYAQVDFCGVLSLEDIPWYVGTI